MNVGAPDVNLTKFINRDIGHWMVPVLEFTESVGHLLDLPVYGEIANSVPTSAAGRTRLKDWKVKVASEVKSARGDKPWDPGNNYAITLGLGFYLPIHGNQKKLDVENFIKPIVDALAAGLFCNTETDPRDINHWNYDDSNFNTLLVHRLPDADSPQSEGVAIYVSASPQ